MLFISLRVIFAARVGVIVVFTPLCMVFAARMFRIVSACVNQSWSNVDAEVYVLVTASSPPPSVMSWLYFLIFSLISLSIFLRFRFITNYSS